MTLLERAVPPTAGAMHPAASPPARAALEPTHRAPRAKSQHIEVGAARLRISTSGAGGVTVAALRGPSAQRETAALLCSEDVAA